MRHDLEKLFAAIEQAFETVHQAHPEAITCGKG